MDQNVFQNIKQYLGHKFLTYILNMNFNPGAQFNEIAFSAQQLGVLSSLNIIITNSRIQFIHNGGFGDGAIFNLAEYVDDFNIFRAKCGGKIPQMLDEDPVNLYLKKLAIKFYPILLIKTEFSNFFTHMPFRLTSSDYKEFSKLVKNDVLNNLTNDGEDFEHRFSLQLSNGTKIVMQVSTACSNLISRSFQNTCLRMRYELSDLLAEIDRNILILRNLAAGQETSFSSFIGIKGLHFENFNEIQYSNFILRQIDGHENPNTHINGTLCQHNDGDSEYSTGSVLEIIHSIKGEQLKEDASLAMSQKFYEEQSFVLERLKFALVFSLEADKGIQPSFTENAFPLVQVGNYAVIGKHPEIYSKIQIEKIKEIKDWYETLSTTDWDYVKVPIKRLSFAIFERNLPEDSILDTFIAWEGMFSEAFETTLKVTGSLAKYLYPITERKEKLKRLKELYELRSDLAHGKKNRKFKESEFGKVRAEVISIGLTCLKKLLHDPSLLPLTPSERVTTIMILT